MKIAFLTRNYPPDTLWGGDAVFYRNLARGLASAGHEVHVVCQATGPVGECVEDYQHGRIVVHRVGTKPIGYSVRARIDYYLNAWRKVTGLITERRIQIVEAPDWSAEGFLYVFFGKRTPLVVTALGSTDGPLKSNSGITPSIWVILRVLSAAAKFTCRRADALIAISKESQRAVVRRYGVDRRRVRLLYPGIDTRMFQPAPSDIRGRLGIPRDATVVGFVGRLEPRNGVHVLYEAVPRVVEEIPGTIFVLVGRDTPTGPHSSSWRQHLSKRYGAHVEQHILHIDFLSDDDLVRFYSACDVVVYPALTSTLGLPVLEAMACGKPVVASRVGVVPEIEGHGLRGLAVVPPGAVEPLVEAIVRTVDHLDTEEATYRGQNRAFVEAEFSIQVWADAVAGVYEDLVSRRKMQVEESG